MKIAILGSRGIPNNHGGFEQFAEIFSVYAAKLGHEVYVYNSHTHTYTGEHFRGVKIIKCKDPEYRIGTVGQFIYDFNCIKDARNRKFDIILQLGYTSSSVWAKLLPKESVIITNMDGMEWKRSKYTNMVQKFLRSAEKWAIKSSDYLISDSIGIREYIKKKYDKDSTYIPYGANIFVDQDFKLLEEYALKKYKYSLIIARAEPENNIELIIKGYLKSKFSADEPLVVVGDTSTTKHGRHLRNLFCPLKNIRFLGSIYDLNVLNNLRYYSRFYFHGHSVGGTNPSLLEAMGSGALVVANDNIFNRSILEREAFYFKSSSDISLILNQNIKKQNHPFLLKNKEKIEKKFSWDYVNNKYLDTFTHALQNKQVRG